MVSSSTTTAMIQTQNLDPTDRTNLRVSSPTMTASKSRRLRLQGEKPIASVKEKVELFESITPSNREMISSSSSSSKTIHSGSPDRRSKEKVKKAPTRRSSGESVSHVANGSSVVEERRKTNSPTGEPLNTSVDFNNRQKERSSSRKITMLENLKQSKSNKMKNMDADPLDRENRLREVDPLDRENKFNVTNRNMGMGAAIPSPGRRRKLEMIANVKKNRRSNTQRNKDEFHHGSRTPTFKNGLTQNNEEEKKGEFQASHPPSVGSTSVSSGSPDMPSMISKEGQNDSDNINSMINRLDLQNSGMIHYEQSEKYEQKAQMGGDSNSIFEPIPTTHFYDNNKRDHSLDQLQNFARMDKNRSSSMHRPFNPEFDGNDGITSNPIPTHDSPTFGRMPLDFNHYDEDDDTQFNSVSMPTKNEKRGSKYDTTGTVENSRRMKSQNEMIFSDSRGQGYSIGPRVENDDDSLTLFTEGDESVTNGSWTGRMRARQAAEAMAAEREPSRSSNRSLQGKDHALSTFSPSYRNSHKRSISTNQRSSSLPNQQEETTADISEDPKTVAFTLGVAGAMCGAILMGPIGLLIGAGIGVGVWQVPEDQRKNMSDKASSVVDTLQESAINANEVLSTSCATACGNPQNDTKAQGGSDQSVSFDKMSFVENRSTSMSPPKRRRDGSGGSVNGNSQIEATQRVSPYILARSGSRSLTPACCRMGRITPVHQIHSLDPSLHPRAWLEVMSNAWTSREEKNEAMEEMLILAKDKHHSKMLLEEGILDSLMFIIRGFFRKYKSYGRGRVEMEVYLTDPNYRAAKLASNCCVALGKAHCALVQAEGDTSVTVNYGFGSIPVSRQVAQMLFEVPHHLAIENEAGENDPKSQQFSFTAEMTMGQAEGLARCIAALAEGDVEIDPIIM